MTLYMDRRRRRVKLVQHLDPFSGLSEDLFGSMFLDHSVLSKAQKLVAITAREAGDAPKVSLPMEAVVLDHGGEPTDTSKPHRVCFGRVVRRHGRRGYKHEWYESESAEYGDGMAYQADIGFDPWHQDSHPAQGTAADCSSSGPDRLGAMISCSLRSWRWPPPPPSTLASRLTTLASNGCKTTASRCSLQTKGMARARAPAPQRRGKDKRGRRRADPHLARTAHVETRAIGQATTHFPGDNRNPEWRKFPS